MQASNYLFLFQQTAQTTTKACYYAHDQTKAHQYRQISSINILQTFRPFCGRVYPQQQIGLVPTKQYGQRKTKKRQLPVLNNHKKWLEKFKQDIQMKRTTEEFEEKRRLEALEKIRQEGRDRIKQVTSKQFVNDVNNNQSVINKEIRAYDNNQQSRSVQKPQKNQRNITKQNAHKKKPKPAWAQTQQQNEWHEQQQVDQLLDFFQKGQPQQVKDYVNDEDIKKILVELKGKIEVLREQGAGWRENQLIRIQEDDKNNNQQRKQRQRNNNDDKDDILSRISKQSGSQSVTSQKTVQRVQQLQKKKQTRQWDKLTTTSKSSIASVDEQIAKHIADEILRNYPNLKHHSNQSVRKLLEKQAREELRS